MRRISQLVLIVGCLFFCPPPALAQRNQIDPELCSGLEDNELRTCLRDARQQQRQQEAAPRPPQAQEPAQQEQQYQPQFGQEQQREQLRQQQIEQQQQLQIELQRQAQLQQEQQRQRQLEQDQQREQLRQQPVEQQPQQQALPAERAQPVPPAQRGQVLPNLVAVPAVPSATSPGSASSPGQTMSGASVSLRWNAVSGATQYDLGVRDMSTNQLVVNQRVSGTSFNIGVTIGRQYRWNVAACNSAGCSSFTTPLYFNSLQTAAPAPPTPAPAAPSSIGHSYADDYPYSDAAVDTVDPWNFYYRECTSYVAWRLNRDAGTRSYPYFFHNLMGGGRWSNADNWEQNAAALGYRVDSSPERGAIAHWRASEIGSVGHVAYVERVNADGSVDVTEYNYPNGHRFGARVNVKAPRYIHVGSRSPSPTPAAATVLSVPASPSPGIASSPGQTMSGTSVRLSWSAVSGATQYDLGVRDMSTNQLVVNQRVSGTSFTASINSGRQYRWNVAACNNAGCSSFTPPLYFNSLQTAAPAPPPAPAPLALTIPPVPSATSPGSASSPGQTMSGASVSLRWNAVSGATQYDLGVRDMSTNQLVVNQRVSGTSFTANLSPGRQYRWNVAACNDAGCSSFTPPLYFNSLQTAAPAPPTPAPAAPSIPPVPQGASPGSASSPGQTMSGTSVRLSWSSVNGATQYNLGVRDMVTNQLVVDQRVTGTSFTANLSPGRQYRWNVSACNSAGCSSFTTRLYFKTP